LTSVQDKIKIDIPGQKLGFNTGPFNASFMMCFKTKKRLRRQNACKYGGSSFC